MKTIDRTTAVLAGIIGAMTPRIAQAHLVNTEVGEFYAGMLHPLTSAEHLLPILVLAVLASQCRREAARWTLAIFPAALMAGVGAGRLLGPAQIVHLTSLLALMVMGGLLALGRPVDASVLLGTAGTVGLLLGYRSGVDMADGGVALPFLPGVGLSGFITLVLVTAWVPQKVSCFGHYLPRAAGAAGVVAGLFLIVDMPWAVGGSGARSVGLPSNQTLAMLVRTGSLSPAIVAAAVLGATVWGAAHAFTPGHGKAIVAAYLVGSRSTAWHAAYLGLTVTATHTLTIFLLGLALVLAFSFGLAGVLVAVGLIFVRGGQLLERMPKVNPALHLMPVLSALLVAALGFWVTASAVLEMWA
ncbi:MAG: HupE/UreJ family protein [Desulfobacterales bacterium]